MDPGKKHFQKKHLVCVRRPESLITTPNLFLQKTPEEELKVARTQLLLAKSLVTIRPTVAVTIGEKADLWIATYKTIEIFEINRSGGYSLKHKLEVGMAGSFITCMAKSTAGKFVFTGHNDSKIGQFVLFVSFFSFV